MAWLNEIWWINNLIDSRKKSSNLKILNKTKRYEFEIEISKVLACAM